MSLIFQHKIVSSILATLIFSLFVLPVNKSIWFTVPITDVKSVTLSYILTFIFGVAFFALSWFIINFVEKIVNRNGFYIKWLKYASIYFVLLFFVFLLIYPGWWIWDEFLLLDDVQVYDVASLGAQTVFTRIYYTLCLYLIPTAVGIVLIQLLMASFIIGYVASHISYLIKSKWLVALLFLVLLLSPILLNNFYPLRLTPYAYLLLLFIFKFLLLFIGSRPTKNRYGTFLFFSALLAIIAFYRTEGVFYLILLPVIAYKLRLISDLRNGQIRKPVLAILASIGMIALSYTAIKVTTNPEYQLTATMNPLSIMIQSELRGSNVDKNLESINKVIDLDVLKEWPSFVETPSLWASSTPVLRPDFEEHIPEYNRAFVELVVNNPKVFINTKLKTFLATHSIRPVNEHNAFVGWLTEYRTAWQIWNYYPQHWLEQNKLSKPLNEGLRRDVLQFLLQQDSKRSPVGLRSILWNVTPVLIVLLMVMVHALIKRRWIWVAVGILIFIHTLLVFLSAPANYFMYYFPVYLVGSVVSITYIILLIDLWLNRRKIKRNSVVIGGNSESMQNTPFRILVAIPAYNCEKQIPRVIAGFDNELLNRIEKVIVIDNGSTDGTVEAAKKAAKKLGSKKVEIWQNKNNYSLGGTHKVAFLAGEKLNADYVAILHGDDQAKTSELANLIDYAEKYPEAGAILGCRFMKGSKLKGYDQKRIWGNRAINVAYSVVALRPSRDLGSGLNLFRLADLKDRRYLGFDDTLTFNIDLLLDYFRKKTTIAYIPITWSEEDQVSNARNLNIGTTALKKLFLWRFNRENHNPRESSYYKSGEI